MAGLSDAEPFGAIAQKSQTRSPMDTRPPLVIGHRGACGYRPEHTAAAYDLAFMLGADAVETDVVATRDGVLVLRHENEVSATTDVAERSEFAGRRRTKTVDGVPYDGWFTEDFTWAELTTLRCTERLGALCPVSRSFDGHYPMLRLEDLLDIFDRAREQDPARRLIIELKNPTYYASLGIPLVDMAADVLANRGADYDSLIIECLEADALARARKAGITSDLVYLIKASGTPADRVAREGMQAADYAHDVTEQGLDEICAWNGEFPDASHAGFSSEAARVNGIISGISVHSSLLFQTDAGAATSDPSGLVGAAHHRDLSVFSWTLRPQNLFLPERFRVTDGATQIGHWRQWYEQVLGTLLDGVFADNPDLVRTVIGSGP